MKQICSDCSGGAWVNDNKLTYKYDALERQNFEQRHDWGGLAWAARYDTTQVYDKNGNRTGYDKNVTVGYTADYGRNENLSYTFNNVNALTQVTDSDEANYLAAVTCDANGNITQLDERTGAGTLGNPYNYLYTYFEYDDLNRLAVHKDKRYVAGGTNSWVWTKRSHAWDGVGRLVASTLRSWNDGSNEPSGDSLEHTYAGSRHIQNYDGSSTYGARWHWAGTQNDHGAPLRAPSADRKRIPARPLSFSALRTSLVAPRHAAACSACRTAQQAYYTPAAGGAGQPERRSFLVTGTARGRSTRAGWSTASATRRSS